MNRPEQKERRDALGVNLACHVIYDGGKDNKTVRRFIAYRLLEYC